MMKLGINFGIKLFPVGKHSSMPRDYAELKQPERLR